MSHENKNLNNIIEILQKKNLYNSYRKYLPTPEYLKNIITLTNRGRIVQARKNVDCLDEIAKLLDEGFYSEEKTWLLSIISMLHEAIASRKT